MSSMHNNGERGITLKSLADLGSVIDLQTLPPGPEPESTTDDDVLGRESSANLGVSAPQDLAGLLAQLASLSGGLENMARQDARAREQATIELAQYETVLAERQDAERALVEARRLRAGAEQLAAEAFSDEARAHAAQHATVARTAELGCTQLLAERTRVADELASRPHVARAIAERRRLAQQQAEAIERAEAERASRLAQGVAAVRAAISADQLDKAARLLAPLAREFAQDQEVQSLADVIRWRERQQLKAPAEDALRDVLRQPYRDDPEAAVALLAGVAMDGLPEDLARRIFGLWSNACAQLVEQRGWSEPHRLAPATSRGVVFARPMPQGPYEVLSALGSPEWQPGQTVKALPRGARELQSR
jgi:hypothetical protein